MLPLRISVVEDCQAKGSKTKNRFRVILAWALMIFLIALAVINPLHRFNAFTLGYLTFAALSLTAACLAPRAGLGILILNCLVILTLLVASLVNAASFQMGSSDVFFLPVTVTLLYLVGRQRGLGKPVIKADST